MPPPPPTHPPTHRDDYSHDTTSRWTLAAGGGAVRRRFVRPPHVAYARLRILPCPGNTSLGIAGGAISGRGVIRCGIIIVSQAWAPAIVRARPDHADLPPHRVKNAAIGPTESRVVVPPTWAGSIWGRGTDTVTGAVFSCANPRPPPLSPCILPPLLGHRRLL